MVCQWGGGGGGGGGGGAFYQHGLTEVDSDSIHDFKWAVITHPWPDYLQWRLD